MKNSTLLILEPTFSKCTVWNHPTNKIRFVLDDVTLRTVVDHHTIALSTFHISPSFSSAERMTAHQHVLINISSKCLFDSGPIRIKAFYWFEQANCILKKLLISFWSTLFGRDFLWEWEMSNGSLLTKSKQGVIATIYTSRLKLNVSKNWHRSLTLTGKYIFCSQINLNASFQRLEQLLTRSENQTKTLLWYWCMVFWLISDMKIRTRTLLWLTILITGEFKMVAFKCYSRLVEDDWTIPLSPKSTLEKHSKQAILRKTGLNLWGLSNSKKTMKLHLDTLKIAVCCSWKERCSKQKQLGWSIHPERWRKPILFISQQLAIDWKLTPQLGNLFSGFPRSKIVIGKLQQNHLVSGDKNNILTKRGEPERFQTSGQRIGNQNSTVQK